MGRKLSTTKTVRGAEPRTELVNHIAEQVAGILGDKKANPAEMGMTAIVTLQIMLQYGKDNNVTIPTTMEIDTPEGFRFSFKIEQIDPTEVPVSPMGLLKGLN